MDEAKNVAPQFIYPIKFMDFVGPRVPNQIFDLVG